MVGTHTSSNWRIRTSTGSHTLQSCWTRQEQPSHRLTFSDVLGRTIHADSKRSAKWMTYSRTSSTASSLLRMRVASERSEGWKQIERSEHRLDFDSATSFIRSQTNCACGRHIHWIV